MSLRRPLAGYLLGRELDEALEAAGVARGAAFTISAGTSAPGDLGAAVAPHRKARGTDPDTSHLAAKLAFPRAGNQRRLIIDTMAKAPGVRLTAERIAELAQIPYVSASTRISELKEGGWVMTNGTAQTSSGGDADVLELTESAWHYVTVGVRDDAVTDSSSSSRSN